MKMMRKMTYRLMPLLPLLLLPLLALLPAGCIENNIPYPRIQPDFLSFDADGLLKPAEIDTENRMITLTFDEETDITAVEVTG